MWQLESEGAGVSGGCGGPVVWGLQCVISACCEDTYQVQWLNSVLSTLLMSEDKDPESPGVAPEQGQGGAGDVSQGENKEGGGALQQYAQGLYFVQK